MMFLIFNLISLTIVGVVMVIFPKIGSVLLIIYLAITLYCLLKIIGG
jgi:hypothetical protein